MCHSTWAFESALEVDMGVTASMGYVQIYNRDNSNDDVLARLGVHEIWVGDAAGVPLTKCSEATADAHSAIVWHACGT